MEALPAVDGEICGVKAFKEKPDYETALRYVEAGNYLWNAGIFVWNVEKILIDLGNWASLHDKLTKDANGNGAVGNIKLYECSNCVFHAEDARKVVLQGLDNYIVSEKNYDYCY